MIKITLGLKRRAILLWLCLIAGIGAEQAQAAPRFMEGFGDAIWGMNRNDVKAVFEQFHKVQLARATWDSGKYHEYTYVDTAAELEYQVFPEYVLDSLCGVMLAFDVNGVSTHEVTYAFRQLEVVLVEDNGLPDKVSAQMEPLRATIANAWVSVWDKPETEISLFLAGQTEQRCVLGISYVCKELEALYDPEEISELKTKLAHAANRLGVTANSLAQGVRLSRLREDFTMEPESTRAVVKVLSSERFPEPDEYVPVEQNPVEIQHETPSYPEAARSSGDF